MNNRKPQSTWIPSASATAAFLSLALPAAAQPADWQSQAISPVANPIYFEDPRITSEARPIFMEHFLPSTFHFEGGKVGLGGDAQVYALQLRYALTDRLGLIATKDGYIVMHPDAVLPHAYGWADLAAGLKYAVIDDRENALLVTPGFTFEVPTGNTEVMQGNGKGEWNVFVSAEKGFDKLHLTANVGSRIPDDFSQQTAQLHYSLQADYFVNRYFIPFAVMNGFTVLTDGDNKLLGAVTLNTELADLINFGSTDAQGSTLITVGGGVRSKVCQQVDVGVAYEAGVTENTGIFDSRVTADMIWHF